MTTRFILLHPADGERRPVLPEDVFYLEAEDRSTTIRLRSNRLILDPRPLGELEPIFAPHGFLRIHRNHMVNLARVQVVRRRDDDGQDWEVKLEPPVNRVLTVARLRLEELWAAYGE